MYPEIDLCAYNFNINGISVGQRIGRRNKCAENVINERLVRETTVFSKTGKRLDRKLHFFWTSCMDD